jgi:hypothetical protein
MSTGTSRSRAAVARESEGRSRLPGGRDAFAESSILGRE